MASRASVSFSFGSAAVAACAVVWVACSSSSSTTSSNDGGTSSSSGSSSGSTSSSGSSGSSSGSTSSSGSGGSSGSSGSGSGSSSGGGDDDSGTVTPPVDSGLNEVCPAVPCPTGQTCCANISTAKPSCQTSCDPTDVIGCTGASSCTDSDAGTECCATAVLENNPDGAAFPACEIKSLTSFCGACTTTIGLSCTATEKLHVCSQTSDCANDGTNTLCCAIDGYNICASAIDKTFGKLTCM